MADKEQLMKLVLTIEANPKGRTRMYLEDQSTGFDQPNTQDPTIWDVPDVTDAFVMAEWLMRKLKSKSERALENRVNGGIMAIDLSGLADALFGGARPSARKDS